MPVQILMLFLLMIANPQEKTLFDFSEPNSTQNWNIINDGVMGGLSRSTIRWSDEGVAVFSGVVSLENNGGFASVRTAPRDFQIADYKGIKLRLKGDGKTYQFRIRTDNNFDGVAHTVEFTTTDGKWSTVELPFSSFSPTFRGRTLRNVGPLAPADIRQIGFLISGKQEGSFQLMVDWIKAM